MEYHYVCYNPLLFSCGDIGWHQEIERVDKRKKKPFCKDNLLINPHQTTSTNDLFDREMKGPNKNNSLLFIYFNNINNLSFILNLFIYLFCTVLKG